MDDWEEMRDLKKDCLARGKGRAVGREDKLEVLKVGHGARFPPVMLGSTGTFLKESGEFGVPRLGFGAAKVDGGGRGINVKSRGEGEVIEGGCLDGACHRGKWGKKGI